MNGQSQKDVVACVGVRRIGRTGGIHVEKKHGRKKVEAREGFSPNVPEHSQALNAIGFSTGILALDHLQVNVTPGFWEIGQRRSCSQR
jgi:hypothetical protein